MKEDVYEAVKHLFLTGNVLKQVNNTVTLVPKIHNITHVKDFRSISCYTMIYKLVSKILTNRIQPVIGDVVNLAQTGFILGREISDIILLAT